MAKSVYVNKHLSDDYPTQTYPKQGEVLSPLLFNFRSEYVKGRAKKIRRDWK
jgi:hypothetical protein